MAQTVQQLLNNLSKPVTADFDEPLEDALNRMFKHDYSQLPVVKGTGQDSQFFLVTVDAILGKLSAFGAAANKTNMFVREALVKVNAVYFQGDDLFELLQGLEKMPAALVVNEDRQLTHIVTPYDTSLYFRQWSEDLMRAREIENTLKSYINASFKLADGEIDEQARQRAVDEVAAPTKQMQRKFEAALSRYLVSQSKEAIVLNEDWVNAGFIQLIKETSKGLLEIPSDSARSSIDLVAATQELRTRFAEGLKQYLISKANVSDKPVQQFLDPALIYFKDSNEQPIEFSDLTLMQYILLFFDSRCWDRCAKVFGKDKATITFMLEGVRQTRNKLAHFHEDKVNAADRVQLKACEELFKEKEKSALAEFEKTAPHKTDPNKAADIDKGKEELLEVQVVLPK